MTTWGRRVLGSANPRVVACTPFTLSTPIHVTSIYRRCLFSHETLAHSLVSVQAVAVELYPYPTPQLSLILDI